MERNPYAPTKAALNERPVVDDDAGSIDGERLASRGRRFANMWIDGFVVNLLSAALDAVIAVVAGRGQQLSFGNSLVTQFILGTFVWLGYYLLMEGLYGRTLGKFVTGTRVVTESGGRPPLRQIYKRTWLRAVPLEAFSFFGTRPGWHDRWSKTRVIRTR